MSLLRDDIYVSLIKETMQKVCNNQSTEVNPNTFWDFLKCQMRSVTIAYSIKNRKKGDLLEKNVKY